jgi:glycosyltransferase involved in cell wall biosynthesis
MAQTLKVAYVLHRFPYLTETFIMREVYWLRKQGVEVDIYSLLSPTHKVVHEQAEELLEITHYSPFLSWSVIRSQLHFLMRSPGKYVKAFVNVLRQTIREPRVLVRALVLFPKSVHFANLIEKKPVHHVHSHFVWLDGIAAGVASDLLGVTFSIHPHAFGLFSRNKGSVKAELRHATQIVTISNFNKRYILDLCPDIPSDHVHIVYCALETDLLVARPRQQKDFPIEILAVGRLIEKKGFEYLVSSCRRLLDRNIDFKCRIVGSGTLEKTLQDQINRLGLQQHVTLVGSLSQKQVLEYYQSCDIFALPCVVASDGDRDGIPVVLMEAMACEIPVITTPVTGIPDLVQHEQTGLLVAERDVDELTAALERLIADPGLRNRLGRQGRQIILDRFDIRKNVVQLAEIFKSISRTYGDSAEPALIAEKRKLQSQSG